VCGESGRGPRWGYARTDSMDLATARPHRSSVARSEPPIWVRGGQQCPHVILSVRPGVSNVGQGPAPGLGPAPGPLSAASSADSWPIRGRFVADSWPIRGRFVAELAGKWSLGGKTEGQSSGRWSVAGGCSGTKLWRVRLREGEIGQRRARRAKFWRVRLQEAEIVHRRRWRLRSPGRQIRLGRNGRRGRRA
jgi:hypothetical protein